jgi:aryl sulfotransferase
MEITWLASYPRSGNTWLRAMLTNLLVGRAATAVDIERRIPDLHRSQSITARGDSPNFVKSHLVLSDELPLLDRTARAIVLVRHPLDVAVSVAHFAARAGTESAPIDAAIAAVIALFAETGGCVIDPKWRHFGTWYGHDSSWLDQDSFPTLIVRYESMLTEPEQALRSVLGFCDVLATDAAVTAAVENASLERMRAVEAAAVGNAVFGRGNRDDPFVRRGNSGGWRTHVDEGTRTVIRGKFGAELARFGYEV